MAEGNKYYWLKLKRDFFKRHDIRIIEEMPNGKDYVLFYLKMLLESIDHGGELRFNETIPYNEQMLAVITHTNIDLVRSAMKVFIQLKMIEVLDDETIYMAEVQKMTGVESASTERVRRHRANLSSKALVLQSNNDVTKCNTEIEKEIEIEIDTEIEQEGVPGDDAPDPPANPPPPPPADEVKVEKHKYGEYKNVLLSDADLEKLKTKFPDWDKRIERLSEYIASKGARYKSHLATICAWARKDEEQKNGQPGSRIQGSDRAGSGTNGNRFAKLGDPI